jgi:hypothetical protein
VLGAALDADVLAGHEMIHDDRQRHCHVVLWTVDADRWPAFVGETC